MTEGGSTELAKGKEPRLPGRDWIVLPVLSIVTICVLAASVEFIARRAFFSSEGAMAKCFVLTDAVTGVRGVPNCTVREKTAEGPWVQQELNSQGYRAGGELGPKQPGTFRIVMTGSSTAIGEHVARESTIAARLPVELSQKTGKRIELYNEGMWMGFSHNAALRFSDVLAAQPDMILWVITRGDVAASAAAVLSKAEVANMQNRNLVAKAIRRAKDAFGSKSLTEAATETFDHTRTAVLLRFLIYQSQSQYVKAYLAGGDDLQGYLKADWSPTWKAHLARVDADAASMEARAKAAGVPFVAFYTPDCPQAAMVSMGTWPDGDDPYKIDRELKAVIESHGGIFVDILPDFRPIPDPERYFYTVDGHPNASGQRLIASFLVKELTDGAVPALKAAGTPKTGLDNGQ